MIFVKKHPHKLGSILAMCDEGLKGTFLAEGKVHMDLSDKNFSFFGDELMSNGDAQKLVSEMANSGDFYSANVVGKDAVDVAVKGGLADQGSVKYIKSVPFVMVFRVDVG